MNMDDVKVRVAHATDAATVRSVAVESWPETYSGILPDEVIRHAIDESYSLANLPQKITSPGGIWFVAEVGDDVYGFCSLSWRESPPRILTMYVRPGAQRRGIGSAMMETLLSFARQREMSTVDVEYAAANEGAARFYARSGFKKIRSWTDNRLGGAELITARLDLRQLDLV